jgi:Cdc6-like AAA superfamily ATPase
MENQEQIATEQVLNAMRQREKDYLERKAPGAIEQTPEQIEFARQYWQRVFSEPQKNTGLSMSRNTNQELPFEDARKGFWSILQLRAAHIEVIDNTPFEWVFDDNQKGIVQNLIKYFINDASCIWPLTKGLFVYGAPGTGKTEIMTALSEFCWRREPQLTKYFKMCSLSQIYVDAKSNKESDPIQPNIQNDRCFDEFGRYTGAIMRYGDLLDITEAIIEQRYERARRYGQLTHFIANATPNELEGSFTPMVFDRLRSMCTSVHFSGTSKR